LHQDKILVRHLGLQPYEPVSNAMHEFTDTRDENTLDEIWLVEHLPVVAQFNLSQRFDMSVLEALVKWLHAHPANDGRPRFSVNLMPLTLMQKEVAADIIALFKHYSVDPQTVIIEVTEEQAFSHSGSSIHNIQQLRDFGFKIAADQTRTRNRAWHLHHAGDLYPVLHHDRLLHDLQHRASAGWPGPAA
jgi:predicted signal transduction protein with EAL and GGDEF domain